MRQTGMGGVAQPTAGISDGGVVITHVSSRMASAAPGVTGAVPSPGERSARTTFAVGRLTWSTREIRMIEPARKPGSGAGERETVH